MPDNIPFEIQVEIIKRLPIKSLVQFRSVSKAWKSVIESSDFIADYTFHNPAQPQHLLIRYYNLYSEEIYVSIVDDDMFPQNKVSLTVPWSVNLLWDSFVVGTSSGLVCLFGYYRYEGDSGLESGEATTVLWNPSIRKSVAITVPDLDRHELATFGFGVCPATSDPKIVKITRRKTKGVTCSSRWQVEVFSLRAGVWRSSFSNLSDNLADFKCPRSQVTVGRFFYRIGVGDNVGSDTGFCFIISFDFSSEEFREIYLPNELALHDAMGLYLFNLCDCLVVLREWIMDNLIEVWMENGDSKLYTKLLTINIPYSFSLPLEFRRNCELMMRKTDNTEYSEALIDYDPFSEQINDLGIESQCYTLLVSSYTESIILLDQKDTLVDDEDDEEMSV